MSDDETTDPVPVDEGDQSPQADRAVEQHREDQARPTMAWTRVLVMMAAALAIWLVRRRRA